MKPFQVLPNIHWIGALHPDLRVFDIIMSTKNGTTYNSYLIQDEKIAIIDTVKQKFSEPYLEHVTNLVNPESIDYIIVQHSEPDHSGSLKVLLEKAKNAQVVCAKSAVKYVQNILNMDIDLHPVSTGDTISLGTKTLTFITSPYIHWPDTMMTYIQEDKLLFPCDLLAAHFCDSRMFDDAVTRDFWPDFKYYFECIMRPYRKNVRNALAKLEPHDINIIAPSHGPILRKDVQRYINAYREWSAPLPPNDPAKILIYYAAAHGNTATMAQAIAEGAREHGVEVELFDTMEINVDQHLTRIEAADALLLGSPTINNDAVKPVWNVLNSLTTIEVKGKLAGSFGSYAWSGDAVKLLDERLTALKFKVPFEGLQALLVPGEEELQACRKRGADIAQELKK